MSEIQNADNKSIAIAGLDPTAGYECDFCSCRPVFKIYSCRNFLIPWTKTWAFQHESDGGWAACRECTELIDANEWGKLSDRAFRVFLELYGPIPECDEMPLKQQFRDLHALFREHMIQAA